MGKWNRNIPFLANTFQQCFNNSANQGYYIFEKFEKPEYKYLGVIRNEFYDGIPVKKILFDNEDLPINGRLMSNYIKNNILFYFDNENYVHINK